MTAFRTPSRQPDATINFKASLDSIEEAVIYVWFKELKFVYKTRNKKEKKLQLEDNGYIDRITSMYGPPQWVYYFDRPQNNTLKDIKTYEDSWMTDFQSFYGMCYIDEVAAVEIVNKIEKAYQDYLFQESFEKALYGYT